MTATCARGQPLVDVFREAAGRMGSRSSAWWLVEAITGAARTDAVSDPARIVPPGECRRIAEAIARVGSGEPLQYVLGSWGFRRLDLICDRRALIPRPETETLVEVALRELSALGASAGEVPARGATVVADLGTGTGAVALSLSAESASLLAGLDVQVLATDLDSGALALARENLACLARGDPAAAARVALLEGSWYGAVPSLYEGSLSLIVSNPPYVSEMEWSELDPEVRNFEPLAALVAGPEGTEAIEEIVTGASRFLRTGGRLAVEIAPHQARTVAATAVAAGLVDVRIEKDLCGRDRVLVAGLAGVRRD